MFQSEIMYSSVLGKNRTDAAQDEIFFESSVP